MIDNTAIIGDDVFIPDDCFIRPFCNIMSGARIGKGCRLGQNVVMLPGSVLGDRCKVQNNVSLFTGVECSDDVFIGPSVTFTNVINPRAFIERKTEYKKTIVKEGATIGAGAVIICGCVIGRYSMIGAGSVVTKNVPDYSLVAGNPARQIGWVSKHGHTLRFESGRATCPETGEVYFLSDLEKNV